MSEVAQFEREFAARLGRPGAVATGFGRGALLLALEAAGVQGREVLLPDFICPQVVEAARTAGARPVAYPVPASLTVEPETITRALTSDTRAAVLVHYFGCAQPHTPEIARLLHARGIILVEDCALALRARHAAGPCGSFGDFAVFSFTKDNWCYGGGVATARHAEDVASMRARREESFTAHDRLCWAYGLLRWLDFACNRPTQCTAAENLGRQLQRLLATHEPRLACDNFFDAGLMHARMPAFAAARARQILRRADQTAAWRCAAAARLRGFWPAAHAATGLALHPVSLPTPEKEDDGAFLVFSSVEGPGSACIARAARHAITLRTAWPASAACATWQERLCYLELSPDIGPDDTPGFMAWLQE
jgi:dTDP-4-amino-4,6-dideoxygalactose transaminase